MFKTRLLHSITLSPISTILALFSEHGSLIFSVSSPTTTHHPLGLDFRLFKDNPMAFWTSTSTVQFESPGTLTIAVCVKTSQLSPGWPRRQQTITCLHGVDRPNRLKLTCCMSCVEVQSLVSNLATAQHQDVNILFKISCTTNYIFYLVGTVYTKVNS